MSAWFVFRPDGAHLGPWSSERVASAILRGEIPENIWLAPARADNTRARWLCALDVPVIVTLVRGTPFAASQRESGMRAVAKAKPSDEEVTLPSARRADFERIDIERVDLDDLDDNSTEAMLTRPLDLRVWTDASLADTYPSARPPVTIPEDARITTERPALRPPSSQVPASDLYARLRRAGDPASERVPRDPRDDVAHDDDDAPTRRAVLLTEPYEPTLVSRRRNA